MRPLYRATTFSTSVINQIAGAPESAGSATFKPGPLVIDHLSGDSYLYVDVNHDGIYEPTLDLTVHWWAPRYRLPI